MRLKSLLFLLLLATAFGTPAFGADERAPIPSKADQDKAVASIKEIFAEQIEASKKPASKKPASQSKLALELMKLGDATQDDAVSQYVLYRVAKDLAAKACDTKTALLAAEKMSQGFQVDAAAMLNDTLDRLGRHAKTAAQRVAIANLALDESETAIRGNRYDEAERMLALAAELARSARDTAMIVRVVGREKRLKDLRKEFDVVEVARKTLAKDPSDAHANSVVGAYYCFARNDWDQGLSYLALGDDPAIKQLAMKELGELTATDAMIALADGWWSVSEQHADRAKQNMQRHAAKWYRESLPVLTGLSKLKIERRIADVEKSVAASGTGDRAGSGEGARQPPQVRRKSDRLTVDRGGARNPAGESTFVRARDRKKMSTGTGPVGSFLVGFRISTRPAFGIRCIASVRPIYQTRHGRLVISPGLGQVTQTVQTVVARDGYAVGKIHTREGMVLNGFHVTFMRVTPTGLDPSDSYASPQLGASTGGSEKTHTSDGKIVVGLCGKGSREMRLMTKLGLVMVPE